MHEKQKRPADKRVKEFQALLRMAGIDINIATTDHVLQLHDLWEEKGEEVTLKDVMLLDTVIDYVYENGEEPPFTEEEKSDLTAVI